METLRLTVRDAIQEYVKDKVDGDPVDVTCNIADIVFEALGVSPKDQDIEGAVIKVTKPRKKSSLNTKVFRIYIILNWWCDETIAQALPVLKDDGSGETMTFKSKGQAERYAKDQLNGNWKIVED